MIINIYIGSKKYKTEQISKIYLLVHLHLNGSIDQFF